MHTQGNYLINRFWLVLAVWVSLSLCAVRAAEKPVEAPWPMQTVPGTIWRAVVVENTPAGQALAKSLLQTDQIGLPANDNAGHRLQWLLPRVGADGAATFPATPAGSTVYVVAHWHNPVRYRTQTFRLLLNANKPATLYLDGKAIRGQASLDKPLTGSIWGHEIRRGVTRMVWVVPGGGETQVALHIAHPGDQRFFTEVPKEFDPTCQVNAYKTLTLTNGLVTATVPKPDVAKGYYRGQRFEQAGFITSLSYAGHSYLLPDKGPANPVSPDSSVGAPEEFFEAIAWADAKPGEPFIKVGVGLYEKPVQEEHTWYTEYWPLELFAWKTKQSARNVIAFTQTVDGPRGWGYQYVKTLRLVPGKPMLRIEHRFTNTGKNTITAEQYNHNWVMLDKQPVNSGYTLTFPYTPVPKKDVSKHITILPNQINVLSTEPMAIPGLQEGAPAGTREHVIVVRNAHTPAAIRISGDFAPSNLTLFLNSEGVAVEPFVKFTIAPGETFTWTRQYEFLVEAQPATTK
ncbi:MAG TPA: hypothetical protein VGL77_15685 [Armatimonadota bacterium]|jgi:hypothetical protein